MNAEHGRYAELIAADIASLGQQVENRRSHVNAETELLEADQRRLEQLEALLKHVKGAE